MTNVIPPPVANIKLSPTEIVSRKTAMAAVSVGEAIISELIGKEITAIPSEHREGLMTAIINNELKI